jgi:hypothetical protein
MVYGAVLSVLHFGGTGVSINRFQFLSRPLIILSRIIVYPPSSFEQTILDWASIGEFVCIYGAGVTGSWFWIRMLQFMPEYIGAWEENRNVIRNPSRWFGLLIAQLCFLVGVQASYIGGATGPETYALVWPIVTVIALLLIRYFYRNGRDLADTNLFVFAVLLQTAGQAVIGVSETFDENNLGLNLTNIPHAIDAFALAGLLLTIFFLPDIVRLIKHDQSNRHLAILPFVVVGTMGLMVGKLIGSVLSLSIIPGFAILGLLAYIIGFRLEPDYGFLLLRSFTPIFLLIILQTYTKVVVPFQSGLI